MKRYAKFISGAVGRREPTLPTHCETLRHNLSFTRFGRYLDDGTTIIRRSIENTEFDRPEFLFLNFMETHSPYSPPASHLRGPPAELNSFAATAVGPTDDPDDIRSAYDDAASYLSDRYREIHAELEENSHVIVTLADHDEYDIWGHPPALNPEITRIPLVVSGSGVDEFGDPAGAPLNVADVYQTVLDIAGIELPEGTRGASLREPLPEDRRCLVEAHGLDSFGRRLLEGIDADPEVTARFETVHHGVATTTGYAFERPTTATETVGVVENASDAIDDLVDDLDVRRVDSEPVDVSDELQQHLEALGYA